MGLFLPHERHRGGDGPAGVGPRRRQKAAGRSVVIHSLEDALAAAEAAAASGRPLRLLSAPAAAMAGGPGWFAAVVARARARHPRAKIEAILDCDAFAGAALAAIRQGGVDALVVRLRPPVRRKLEAMAAKRRIEVLSKRPSPALDLLDAPDPAEACRAYLAASAGLPRRRAVARVRAQNPDRNQFRKPTR
jgi:hypothetical protein